MNIQSAITVINELTPFKPRENEIDDEIKANEFYKIDTVGMFRSIEIHAVSDSLHLVLKTESGEAWEKFIK